MQTQIIEKVTDFSSLNSKIEAHKDTPAAQIGFQLHFKAIERASLLGLFKR